MTAEQISRIALEVVQHRLAQVEALLAAMPAGATLCVHDEPVGSDFAPDRDVYTFTIRAEAHVLAAGETCDARVRREQYGPTPADWPETVAQHVDSSRS